MSEKMLFCVFFLNLAEYMAVSLLFSVKLWTGECNKLHSFDRFRQLALTRSSHFVNVTHVGIRDEEMVGSIYKNGCQDIFFNCKTFCGWNSVKGLWRESHRDKRLLLTYRCGLRQGSLRDLPHCWANEVFLWLERDHPFLG